MLLCSPPRYQVCGAACRPHIQRMLSMQCSCRQEPLGRRNPMHFVECSMIDILWHQAVTKAAQQRLGIGLSEQDAAKGIDCDHLKLDFVHLCMLYAGLASTESSPHARLLFY